MPSQIGGVHSARDAERMLAMVRRLALRLPETSERASRGSPAFFIRERKSFVSFVDNHHGDGELAIWCAAPEGAQAEMIETEPTRFYRPPYVGHRGWLGVRLLTVDQAELGAIVLDAFRTVAPPIVLRQLDG